MMASIRGKSTRPELELRKKLHAKGFRYRLHAPDLKGKPDLVFAQYKSAIFVHGCFWHRHEGCHWCTTPSSNVDFWNAKFDRNVARDKETVEALRNMGWRLAVVWECGLRGTGAEELSQRIADWLLNGSDDFDSGLVRVRNGNGAERE